MEKIKNNKTEKIKTKEKLETTPMYLQMLDYDGHEYYTMMRIF